MSQHIYKNKGGAGTVSSCPRTYTHLLLAFHCLLLTALILLFMFKTECHVRRDFSQHLEIMCSVKKNKQI